MECSRHGEELAIGVYYHLVYVKSDIWCVQYLDISIKFVREQSKLK